MSREIWNKTDSLIFPDGQTRTPEQIFAMKEFGWAQYNTVVLEKHGAVTFAMDDLELLKDLHGVTETDSVQALAAVEQAETEAKNRASDQSELASAISAQNLLAMASDPALAAKALALGLISQQQYETLTA